MQGGKLLGTGSSSCVFSPNIPCKTNGKVDNNRVSKLLFHHDSKNLANYEKKQAELIKKIRETSQKEISQIFKKKVHLYLQINNSYE